MSIENYETLKHCSIVLNQTGLGWQGSVLTANFGGGIEVAAVTSPYGLKRWTLQANILPDNEDDYPLTYTVDTETLTKSRFRYFFEFFQRHILLGNKPFIIQDADTNKKFLVSFAEPNVDFERIAYKLFAGSVVVTERRVADLMFNDDGSIFDAQTPYVNLFIVEALSDTLIRVYMSAGDADAVVGYDLEFTTNSSADVNAAPGTGGWTNILDDATPVSQYDHTGRVGSTRYYYRFRGRDNDENVSPWVTDDAETFATPDVTDPVMTTFDAQGLYSLTEIRILFAATDNQTAASALRYDLQWSLNGTTGWTNLLTKQVATSPVLHQNRTPGIEYFYRMRVWDAADNDSVWSTDSASTLPDTTAPTISSFTASGGNQVINLLANFTDNIGVTGVDLQFSIDATASTGWFNLATNVAPTTPTTYAYAHTVPDGATRYYRLRVRDAAGNQTGYALANATAVSAGGGDATTWADSDPITWADGNPMTFG